MLSGPREPLTFVLTPHREHGIRYLALKIILACRMRVKKEGGERHGITTQYRAPHGWQDNNPRPPSDGFPCRVSPNLATKIVAMEISRHKKYALTTDPAVSADY